MQPKVTVVINTFEREWMMQQAVWSVLTQTMEDWELILAIDHKPDVNNNITKLCQEFSQMDKRIRLVFTDIEPGDKSLNRFARNINIAVRASSGAYISYLCDDDLFVPWRLSVFSRVLDKNPGYDVVYGKQIVWDIPTDRGVEERPAQILQVHPEGRNPFGRVNHNSIMHRRECFDAVGGWVENAPARLGDAYFFARLNQRWAFHPIDCVGEIMRMGEQNCWSGKPQSEAERVNVGAFA